MPVNLPDATDVVLLLPAETRPALGLQCLPTWPLKTSGPAMVGTPTAAPTTPREQMSSEGSAPPAGALVVAGPQQDGTPTGTGTGGDRAAGAAAEASNRSASSADSTRLVIILPESAQPGSQVYAHTPDGLLVRFDLPETLPQDRKLAVRVPASASDAWTGGVASSVCTALPSRVDTTRAPAALPPRARSVPAAGGNGAGARKRKAR